MYQSIRDTSEESAPRLSRASARAPSNKNRNTLILSSIASVLLLVYLFAGDSSLATTNLASEEGGFSEDEAGLVSYFHISDTHIDPFFDPTQSMAHGICHSCRLNKNNPDFYCPPNLPVVNADDAVFEDLGYAFGRYACNPPARLLYSLLDHMKKKKPDPAFIVFTGDIAPHGMPDDNTLVNKNTKLDELCGAKIKAFRQQVRTLRLYFPHTKFVFSMGNNDHFPKNRYWQPYIKELGNMLHEEGFLSTESHEMFHKYGASHYLDFSQEELHKGLKKSDVKKRAKETYGAAARKGGVRFLCLDLTLFATGGELSFVEEHAYAGKPAEEAAHIRFPVRSATVKWFGEALEEAKQKDMSLVLVSHQPLQTKEGKDEMDLEDHHYRALRHLMTQYAEHFSVALFGHINIAGVSSLTDAIGSPIIPTITAPGVSPRGLNNPCFNEMFIHPTTHVVQDFKQWNFNLLDANERAQANKNVEDVLSLKKRKRTLEERLSNDEEGAKEYQGYLGKWSQETDEMFSWRSLSGEPEFTVHSVLRFMDQVTHSSEIFQGYQKWKKGNFVGDEAPENVHCKGVTKKAANLMECLFQNQDPKCFETKWFMGAG